MFSYEELACKKHLSIHKQTTDKNFLKLVWIIESSSKLAQSNFYSSIELFTPYSDLSAIEAVLHFPILLFFQLTSTSAMHENFIQILFNERIPLVIFEFFSVVP